ncbi:MAG: hypothetical protein JWM99_4348, partial [Verrucomicrobiales bacterium]|nr:hypothetical protein [Verrucomicrobiales bacterium]
TKIVAEESCWIDPGKSLEIVDEVRLVKVTTVSRNIIAQSVEL